MTYPNPPIPFSLPKSLKINQEIRDRIDYAVVITYVAVSIAVGLTLILGPNRLHDSSALYLVSGLGLPWIIIACVFFLSALCMMNKNTRIFGWAIGVILYGFYFLSVFRSIVIEANVGSIFGVAAAFISVVTQLRGLAISVFLAEWRK